MEFVASYSMGFYYNQLEIDQKYVYQKIVLVIAMYRQTENINMLTKEEIHKVLLAIKYDNPELCYWSMEGTIINNNKIYLAYYTQSKEAFIKLIGDLRNARKQILDDLQMQQKGMSQTEAMKKIYNYLVENVSYAEMELQKPVSSYWIYDITGVLLKKRAVCLGIALAVNYLFRPLHISSILITGEAQVAGWRCNHGWNLIELEDEYFHLDVTCALGENGEARMKYFLVKDRDLQEHKWPETVYPQAN